MNLYDIIRKPILTEKATILSDTQRKYVFFVDKRATKNLISKAIETIFKVKVEAINVINMKGKTRRFKGVQGKRSDKKKAIVSLAEGHSINVIKG